MNLNPTHPESLAARAVPIAQSDVARLVPARTEVSALELTLSALRPLLARRDVTELCINQPGMAFLETREGWRQERVPFADFDWCRRLAKMSRHW